MANMTDWFQQEFLRWALTTATPMSRPASLFIGVGTAGAVSTGLTEPASGGYTRYQVTSGTFVSSGVGRFVNGQEINFPAATVGWGTISHIGIATVVSGSAVSNFLFIGALTGSVTIGVGDQVRIAPSTLTVSAA